MGINEKELIKAHEHYIELQAKELAEAKAKVDVGKNAIIYAISCLTDPADIQKAIMRLTIALGIMSGAFDDWMSDKSNSKKQA